MAKLETKETFEAKPFYCVFANSYFLVVSKIYIKIK